MVSTGSVIVMTKLLLYRHVIVKTKLLSLGFKLVLFIIPLLVVLECGKYWILYSYDKAVIV